MNRSTKDYLHYIRQLLNGFRARHERTLANMREQDISPYLDADHSLRVLDLANGRLCSQYILLRAAGHQVYGIDLVNRPQLSWADIAYRAARWLYTRKLGFPASIVAGKTLVCGDVNTLPFSDNSFDLVTSIAAFEHFLNVPMIVAEVARVVRPGGLVWACIHLFSSLSGGHNVSLAEIPLRRVPGGIDPWDHLRKRLLPFHVLLNEWRKDQYLEAFAHRFQIIKHYCAVREGEELLTPKIKAELSTYSRDELTCGAYVIVARRAP